MPGDDPGDDWDTGVPHGWLRQLTDYWSSDYDWRRHEAGLNALPQFKAHIDDIDLHFVHAKGRIASATPLLLLHGWPDSFYRFHKIIPMLVDPQQHGGAPADAFDVVVPSLPGFGFSDRRAMSCSAAADVLVKLMNALGYRHFAVAGGDFGAIVAKHLASRYAEAVTAVHVTDVGYPTGQEDFSKMSKAERTFASFVQGWFMKEGAYAMVHSTKPQSLAAGLNDSPAGLSSWIISMIKTGADGDEVEKAFGGCRIPHPPVSTSASSMRSCPTIRRA